MHHAGQDLHLSVTGLESFTTYYIRVQACQIGKYLYLSTWTKQWVSQFDSESEGFKQLHVFSYLNPEDAKDSLVSCDVWGKKTKDVVCGYPVIK